MPRRGSRAAGEVPSAVLVGGEGTPLRWRLVTTALLFPGQGSQRPHVGNPWREQVEWGITSTVASEAGLDAEFFLLQADSDELRRTSAAQVSSFSIGLMVHAALAAGGVRIAYVAGHSVGEYAALVASGVLSVEAAARIVGVRALAMEDACSRNPGTMCAVLGLDEGRASAACARTDDEVWIANFNADDHHVISGSRVAVARACDAAKEAGATRCMPLKVGGAFHTVYMLPAREPLRGALAQEEFADANVPIVANVDARVHACADDWPSLLSAQLCNPVRWAQTIDRLWDQGIRTFIEAGPGRTLTAMLRRSHPDAVGLPVSTPEDLARAVQHLGAQARTDQSASATSRLPGTAAVVQSPANGEVRFPVGTATAEGVLVNEGEVVAHVGGVAVTAPRSGWLVDWAPPGMPVEEGDFLLRIAP